MRHLPQLLLLLLLPAVAVAHTPDKRVKPLLPIPADSIYFMDFFWDPIQQQATEASISTKATFNWEAEPTSQSKLDKRIAQWEQTFANTDIVGQERGKAPSLKRSLDLFEESYHLALLTRNAKYADMAERILFNSILRLKDTPDDPETADRLTMLLRNLDRMAYSIDGTDVYINLFTRANAHLHNDSINVILQSVSSAPWKHQTAITFVPNMDMFRFDEQETINEFKRVIHNQSSTHHTDSCEVTFHIRVPYWVTGENLAPGCQIAPQKKKIRVFKRGIPSARLEMADGYIIVRGKWALNDNISFDVPTPILRITDTTRPGQVALQRGPLVYDVEPTSATAPLLPTNSISYQFDKEEKVHALSGSLGEDGDRFYAVPYFKKREKAQLFIPAH